MHDIFPPHVTDFQTGLFLEDDSVSDSIQTQDETEWNVVLHGYCGLCGEEVSSPEHASEALVSPVHARVKLVRTR